MKKTWWTNQISEIKFCFVCGGKLAKRFVAADKKKRLVCSVCLHITYINPRSVAGLIPVMPDGRIVLLQRDIEPGKGKWTYPAGYQEIGESVAEAAVRETKEEICVRARLVKLVGVYSYAGAGVVTSVFLGSVPRGQRPEPGEESQNVRLFKLSELPWNELAFRSTTDALKDWMKSL